MPIRRLPTPDEVSRALVDILAEPGALPLDDALAGLAARGLSVHPEDPEFADALDFGEGAEELMEIDEWVVHVGALLRGRIFTHRVGLDEAQTDSLALFPDCVAMLFTLPRDVPVEFGDGAVTGDGPPPDVRAPDLCPVIATTDEDVHLRLPAGSLRSHGIKAGDLVGLALTHNVLTVQRFDDAPFLDPATVSLLRGFYDQAEELHTLTELVLRTILQDRSLFTTPPAPLTDLLIAANIPATFELFDDGGASMAENKAALHHVVATTLAKTYDLSPDEAGLLAEFTTALVVTDALRDDADASAVDGPVTPAMATAVRAALADPWFAYVLAEEVYGPDSATNGIRRSGTSPTLAKFLDDTPVTGPRPFRAGLLYLRGRQLEADGSPLAAAATYRQAADLASVPYPLGRLAVIEFYRGNFEVSRSLLDQAGAPAEDLLRDQIDHALGLPVPGQPGGAATTAPERKLSRNEPCWCGSGRKFKVCHARADARAPLPNRAATLYDRLCWFVLEDAGDDIRHLMNLAADVTEGGAPPQSMLPLALDLLLAEGGLMADFHARRGELLAADEAMVLEQWLLGARSVFEVEATTPGESVALRDLRSGDHLVVTERLGSQSLTPGVFVCTRLADVAGDMQAFGGFQPVRLDQRERLLSLLDSGPDPEVLMVVFAGHFAPMQVRTVEGDPMVMCRGRYFVPDRSALVAVLEANFAADEVNGLWLWTEEVGPDEKRTLAVLTLTDGELGIETMSDARFDRVRDLLDGLGVDLVEVEVERVDPMTAADRQGGPDVADDDATSGLLSPQEALAIPELADAIAAKMAAYEQAWLDESIPALAGFTPRQAAADPTRRDDLIRLLDSFPADGSPHQMDGGRLRAALGL